MLSCTACASVVMLPELSTAQMMSAGCFFVSASCSTAAQAASGGGIAASTGPVPGPMGGAVPPAPVPPVPVPGPSPPLPPAPPVAPLPPASLGGGDLGRTPSSLLHAEAARRASAVTAPAHDEKNRA